MSCACEKRADSGVPPLHRKGWRERLRAGRKRRPEVDRAAAEGLVERVRSGDTSAVAALSVWAFPPAGAVARRWTTCPKVAEELAFEAFTEVCEALRAGQVGAGDFLIRTALAVRTVAVRRAWMDEAGNPCGTRGRRAVAACEAVMSLSPAAADVLWQADVEQVPVQALHSEPGSVFDAFPQDTLRSARHALLDHYLRCGLSQVSDGETRLEHLSYFAAADWQAGTIAAKRVRQVSDHLVQCVICPLVVEETVRPGCSAALTHFVLPHGS